MLIYSSQKGEKTQQLTAAEHNRLPHPLPEVRSTNIQSGKKRTPEEGKAARVLTSDIHKAAYAMRTRRCCCHCFFSSSRAQFKSLSSMPSPRRCHSPRTHTQARLQGDNDRTQAHRQNLSLLLLMTRVTWIPLWFRFRPCTSPTPVFFFFLHLLLLPLRLFFLTYAHRFIKLGPLRVRAHSSSCARSAGPLPQPPWPSS